MGKDLINKDFLFWRYLINCWSIVLFVFIVYDFFSNNAYVNFLGILSAIYISVLALYVGNKEFERWYDRHRGQHPGELFVIIWSILIFTLILVDFVLQKPYEVPGAVISTYIAVLTILAITKKSKELYKNKRQKK